jgi:hypothetical protein
LSEVDPHDVDHSPGSAGHPLGRGLERISHLFLSPRPDADQPRATRPAGPGRLPPSAPVVLLRRIAVTRQRLETILLADLDGSFEAGLRLFDARIPCHPCGEIDLLAVDHKGKLTIVDFETTTVNDGLLIRGLGHFDWTVRNLANLQRTDPAQGVDFALPPRLVLLAPQFSPRLRGAVQQLTRPHLDCVRYHTVETPHGPGIFFESVVGD